MARARPEHLSYEESSNNGRHLFFRRSQDDGRIKRLERSKKTLLRETVNVKASLLEAFVGNL